jgi:predicted phage baseplate assembly protein
MPLPAPNLDDRRFQDFVDDAKRLLQRRIPTWTDHNVSDPGVTLIEAVATIADQLSYRLNQVPERHHRKFLDLLGITLRPPTAARTDLTFRLSAARPETITVPSGTAGSTRRSPGEPPVSFTTLDDLEIVSVSLSELRRRSARRHRCCATSARIWPTPCRPRASPTCPSPATGSTSDCPRRRRPA